MERELGKKEREEEEQLRRLSFNMSRASLFRRGHCADRQSMALLSAEPSSKWRKAPLPVTVCAH